MNSSSNSYANQSSALEMNQQEYIAGMDHQMLNKVVQEVCSKMMKGKEIMDSPVHKYPNDKSVLLVFLVSIQQPVLHG